jgi:glycosyltransferase involved in cell wall biosynthesis
MIYNGIDTAKLHCESDSAWLKEQFQIPAEHKTVVHVGTFRPQKNHARIIGTAKAYLVDNPNTCFVLVGDGALRNDIEELAKQKGINTNVRFAGIRSDTARILKSADALLFPSVSEGLPGVILEAMAAGLPIVAGDLPGIREIIEICGDAKLLPPEATDAQWAQALAKAIDKPRQPQWLDQIENSPFALSNSWRQLLNIYYD